MIDKMIIGLIGVFLIFILGAFYILLLIKVLIIPIKWIINKFKKKEIDLAKKNIQNGGRNLYK